MEFHIDGRQEAGKGSVDEEAEDSYYSSRVGGGLGLSETGERRMEEERTRGEGSRRNGGGIGVPHDVNDEEVELFLRQTDQQSTLKSITPSPPTLLGEEELSRLCGGGGGAAVVGTGGDGVEDQEQASRKKKKRRARRRRKRTTRKGSQRGGIGRIGYAVSLLKQGTDYVTGLVTFGRYGTHLAPLSSRRGSNDPYNGYEYELQDHLLRGNEDEEREECGNGRGRRGEGSDLSFSSSSDEEDTNNDNTSVVSNCSIRGAHNPQFSHRNSSFFGGGGSARGGRGGIVSSFRRSLAHRSGCGSMLDCMFFSGTALLIAALLTVIVIQFSIIHRQTLKIERRNFEINELFAFIGTSIGFNNNQDNLSKTYELVMTRGGENSSPSGGGKSQISQPHPLKDEIEKLINSFVHRYCESKLFEAREGQVREHESRLEQELGSPLWREVKRRREEQKEMHSSDQTAETYRTVYDLHNSGCQVLKARFRRYLSELQGLEGSNGSDGLNAEEGPIRELWHKWDHSAQIHCEKNNTISAAYNLGLVEGVSGIMDFGSGPNEHNGLGGAYRAGVGAADDNDDSGLSTASSRSKFCAEGSVAVSRWVEFGHTMQRNASVVFSRSVPEMQFLSSHKSNHNFGENYHRYFYFATNERSFGQVAIRDPSQQSDYVLAPVVNMNLPSFFGTPFNYVSQPHSVLDQLRLGVRKIQLHVGIAGDGLAYSCSGGPDTPRLPGNSETAKAKKRTAVSYGNPAKSKGSHRFSTRRFGKSRIMRIKQRITYSHMAGCHPSYTHTLEKVLEETLYWIRANRRLNDMYIIEIPLSSPQFYMIDWSEAVEAAVNAQYGFGFGSSDVKKKRSPYTKKLTSEYRRLNNKEIRRRNANMYKTGLQVVMKVLNEVLSRPENLEIAFTFREFLDSSNGNEERFQAQSSLRWPTPRELAEKGKHLLVVFDDSRENNRRHGDTKELFFPKGIIAPQNSPTQTSSNFLGYLPKRLRPYVYVDMDNHIGGGRNSAIHCDLTKQHLRSDAFTAMGGSALHYGPLQNKVLRTGVMTGKQVKQALQCGYSYLNMNFISAKLMEDTIWTVTEKAFNKVKQLEEKHEARACAAFTTACTEERTRWQARGCGQKKHAVCLLPEPYEQREAIASVPFREDLRERVVFTSNRVSGEGGASQCNQEYGASAEFYAPASAHEAQIIYEKWQESSLAPLGVNGQKYFCPCELEMALSPSLRNMYVRENRREDADMELWINVILYSPVIALEDDWDNYIRRKK
eukprot:Nk52_evm2s331 gene=Nk52_evmTU2s331